MICWHWGNPLVGPGYVNSKIHFDAVAAPKPGALECVAMMRDIDEIAVYLSNLCAPDIPVL